MASFLDQPKGMWIIGCTEIFERLSFYTLAALLILYATATPANGGLGWSKDSALLLMGNFTLAVFTFPLVGGFIADRFLGPFRSAILGGVLITIGHTVMYFSNYGLPYFYTALVLIVCGTGFFTPCTPTLLGQLYNPTDARRVSGFNLYYMGINIGGLIAGFLAGVLLSAYGYQVALASAAVTMMLGLCVFIGGKRFLNTEFTKKAREKAEHTKKPLTPKHKKAIFYLLVSFVFFALWAIVYNLVISGTLSIYIEFYTQKTVFGYDIPTTFFSSLESIGIVVFAPIVSFFLTYLASKKRPIHFFTQMFIGLVLTFVAVAFFTYLSKVAQTASLGTKPFHYMSIALFILIVSLSELLISPVAMVAISVLSPKRFSTSFQALNLSLIGFMGVVASKIGALSLDNPYKVFYSLSAVTLLGVIVFFLLRKLMVKAAQNASNELENADKLKT